MPTTISGNGLQSFPGGKRHFEQAPRVDRPPPTLSYATPGSLPATQGQRYANDERKHFSKCYSLQRETLDQ
jgi:hypothetical protein